MFKSGFGVALMIIWAVGAILGGLMTMTMTVSATGNSSSAVGNFLDTGTNVETVKIDTPGAGSQSNPVSTVIGYSKIAADAVGYLAQAATWDFSFFEGWGQLIRFGFLGISAIYVISAVVDISAPLSFLITSLGNAAAGILNAFLGKAA